MSSIRPPVGTGPTEPHAYVPPVDAIDAAYLLSVLEGADAGTTFKLDATSATRTLIGTSPVCHARLADRRVSRRHGAFAVAPGHLQYMDLGSTNGTLVNGVAVKEVFLHGGETLRIGDSVITVRRGPPEASNVAMATGYGRLLGESLAMRRIYPVIERLAATDLPILIEGEAGTGKELLAEEVHRASRAQGPFVQLETASVPSTRIGPILFGGGDPPGLVESAQGGVLFIDEIGDLPRAVQTRLRELLSRPSGVRVIAATKRDLDLDVTAGRFDDALFFQLASGRIELPPLRDRAGDVRVLAKHFWTELAAGGASEAAELPGDLLPRLEYYRWPGNVRELRSAVTRRATLGELSTTYLSDHARKTGDDIVGAAIADGLGFVAARERAIFDFERRYIQAVIERHGGDIAAAARASGVARRYFQLLRARVR